MKIGLKKQHLLILLVIVLLIVPYTRVKLQILLHKGLSFVNQSTILSEEERVSVKFDGWQLISDENNVIQLDETDEEIIFLNFWATWCPPCIAEMPSLQNLYDDYSEQVRFVFVTTDSFEKVDDFKIKNNFDFTVYQSIGGIPKALRTNSIPRTFIMNKSGKIVVDESGAIDWNSQSVRNQLDALLAE